MSRYVLVVDDDAQIRELLTIALGEEGYLVRAVPDGEAALEAVAEAPPAVILLDMRMPVMDGWTFAREYRRRYNGNAKPVLCMSAAVDARQVAREIKPDGLLPKPFSLDELLTAVALHAGAPA